MQLKSVLNKFPKEVYGLAILAFILRIIPIKYGLPLHLNIDEPALVSGSLLLKNSLNIGRFDWPHLYFYINFLFYLPGYLLVNFFKLPFFLEGDGIYFAISRALSAIFGVLTLFSIFKITELISKNKSVAIASVLMLSLLPVHVYESFFAKLDVSLTFFVSLAIYGILKISEGLNTKTFLITGALIGLSVSIKYNAFLLYIPFIISWAYLTNKQTIKTVKLYLLPIYSGIVSIIVFFMGTPFALIDYKTFWSDKPRVGVLWQFQNVGSVPWEEYSVHVYETFANMYRSDLGIGIWIIFITLIIFYLFFNYRNRYLNILLLPTIFISFYISKLDRSPSHYFIFLIPMYLPLIANFMWDISTRFSNLFRNLRVRTIYWIFVVILMIPSIYLSVRSTAVYARTDTRLDAYNWVRENVSEKGYFLYVAGDGLSEVPFQKNDTLKIKRIDPDQIDQPLPVYLVVGYEGINLEDFVSQGWNPKGIGGSSERVLNDKALVKYFDNTFNPGPPVLIFRIEEMQDD